MSFKRVGDDYDANKILKKQRVCKLLLEDIPEDEATVAKNGRFVCLVCSRRPVFDTVPMLCIHRQGKKHLAALGVRLEKQREIADLRQKREHDKYLEKLQNSLHCKHEKSPLLKNTQKNKELILQMNSQQQSSDFVNNHLPNSSITSSKIKSNIPFFQSRSEKTVLDLWSTTHTLQQRENPKHSINIDSKNKQVSSKAECEVSTNKQVKTKKIKEGGNKTRQSVSGACSTEFNDRKKRLGEYYTKLSSAGWIMGTDGKWKKDETAEFDSDEEEPPLPPDL